MSSGRLQNKPKNIAIQNNNHKLASLQDSGNCTFDVLPKWRPSRTEKYYVHCLPVHIMMCESPGRGGSLVEENIMGNGVPEARQFKGIREDKALR
jgi:hypothetical protein